MNRKGKKTGVRENPCFSVRKIGQKKHPPGSPLPGQDASLFLTSAAHPPLSDSRIVPAPAMEPDAPDLHDVRPHLQHGQHDLALTADEVHLVRCAEDHL